MSKIITESIENAAGYRTDAVHLIETQTASSSASIDFVLPAGYYKHVLVFDEVLPATDAADLYLRTSADGGSTFDSGASNYEWGSNYQTAGAHGHGTGSTAATEIEIAYDVGSGTNEGISGEVTIFNPSASTYTRMVTDTVKIDATPGTFTQQTGYGARKSAAVVDAIQLLFDSGNIASGTFKLYGWKS